MARAAYARGGHRLPPSEVAERTIANGDFGLGLREDRRRDLRIRVRQVCRDRHADLCDAVPLARVELGGDAARDDLDGRIAAVAAPEAEPTRGTAGRASGRPSQASGLPESGAGAVGLQAFSRPEEQTVAVQVLPEVDAVDGRFGDTLLHPRTDRRQLS